MGDSDIRVVFIGFVDVPMYRRRCPRIAGQLMLVVGVLVGVLVSVLVGVLISLGGSAGSAHGVPGESVDRGVSMSASLSVSLGGCAATAHSSPSTCGYVLLVDVISRRLGVLRFCSSSSISSMASLKKPLRVGDWGGGGVVFGARGFCISAFISSMASLKRSLRFGDWGRDGDGACCRSGVRGPSSSLP